MTKSILLVGVGELRGLFDHVVDLFRQREVLAVVARPHLRLESLVPAPHVVGDGQREPVRHVRFRRGHEKLVRADRRGQKRRVGAALVFGRRQVL